MFIRVHSCSFVFIRVHSCSLVFYSCSDLCGVLDMIIVDRAGIWSGFDLNKHLTILNKIFVLRRVQVITEHGSED